VTPTCRLTDDWLPLPEPVLRALGWREGDQLELEVVDGTLIVTLKTPNTPR
jgi:bifunctional DNA-binding transcriptional regulator/antitoxin component of YhaV-PrlF toxin-antitoxin module